MFNRKIILGVAIFTLISFWAALPVSAQEELTLEVAPPLFQVSIAPGGTWNSQVKVVNPNPYPISVFPRVADYIPFDDRPGGELINRRDVAGAEKFSPSLWTTISNDTVVIPRESGINLKISVEVPDEAEAGTHTAAIVVGSAPEGIVSQVGMGVSTSVTSLLVMTVLGDANAQGMISKFETGRAAYQSAEADFTLELTNIGNVHIEPKGEIIIRNIWGRERGRVPIEVEEELRLILPDETKTFRFVWKGEDKTFDVGMYKAEASVRYGKPDSEAEITASLIFWVIPLLPMLVVGSGLLLFILLLSISVKAIIERILLREALMRRVQPFGSLPPSAVENARQGSVIDLRAQNSTKDAVTPSPRPHRKASPLIRIGVVVSGIFAVFAAGIYIINATQEKEYSVGLTDETGINIVGADELFKLTEREDVPGSEILVEQEQKEEEAEVAIEVRILIQNGSGISGKAGEAGDELRKAGFTTVTSENADSFDYTRTIIRYKTGRGAIAEQIKILLDVDPIIEEITDDNLPEEVVVVLGQDIG